MGTRAVMYKVWDDGPYNTSKVVLFNRGSIKSNLKFWFDNKNVDTGNWYNFIIKVFRLGIFTETEYLVLLFAHQPIIINNGCNNYKCIKK